MRPGMASQMVFKKVAAPIAVGSSMQTRYVLLLRSGKSTADIPIESNSNLLPQLYTYVYMYMCIYVY